MSWFDDTISFYECQADNFGRPRTFRQIILTDVAVPHRYYYKHPDTSEWVDGITNDLNTICELRELDGTEKDYAVMKSRAKATLQCSTASAYLKCKKKGQVEEIRRTGIMQFDFDEKGLEGFNLEEVKHAVFFALDFIGFSGLSCSGKGFYALALIAEPEKLSQYAEHCFEVFKKLLGTGPDESKGKKPESLRYVSYDCNMLIRDYPKPLEIKNFYTKSAPKKDMPRLRSSPGIAYSNKLVLACMEKIAVASVGNRWDTIQQVAYTLGGMNKPEVLIDIKRAITINNAFSGEEPKYFKCAEDCFAAGSLKPLIKI